MSEISKRRLFFIHNPVAGAKHPERLRRRVEAALAKRSMGLQEADEGFALVDKGGSTIQRLTTDRDRARDRDDVDMLGLDHPLVAEELRRWQNAAPERDG